MKTSSIISFMKRDQHETNKDRVHGKKGWEEHFWSVLFSNFIRGRISQPLSLHRELCRWHENAPFWAGLPRNFRGLSTVSPAARPTARAGSQRRRLCSGSFRRTDNWVPHKYSVGERLNVRRSVFNCSEDHVWPFIHFKRQSEVQ